MGSRLNELGLTASPPQLLGTPVLRRSAFMGAWQALGMGGSLRRRKAPF